MDEPHNHRAVGYSMILVSASLVVIALLYLAIGDDVLYSDRVGKQKQAEYKQFLEEMKEKQAQVGTTIPAYDEKSGLNMTKSDMIKS